MVVAKENADMVAEAALVGMARVAVAEHNHTFHCNKGLEAGIYAHSFHNEKG